MQPTTTADCQRWHPQRIACAAHAPGSRANRPQQSTAGMQAVNMCAFQKIHFNSSQRQQAMDRCPKRYSANACTHIAHVLEGRPILHKAIHPFRAEGHRTVVAIFSVCFTALAVRNVLGHAHLQRVRVTTIPSIIVGIFRGKPPPCGAGEAQTGRHCDALSGGGGRRGAHGVCCSGGGGRVCASGSGWWRGVGRWGAQKAFATGNGSLGNSSGEGKVGDKGGAHYVHSIMALSCCCAQ